MKAHKQKFDSQLFLPVERPWFVEIIKGQWTAIRGQVIGKRIDGEMVQVQFRKKGPIGQRQITIEEVPYHWTKAL